jgi:hypothetical protein
VAFNGSHSSGSIVSYRWSFGDGTAGAGATPTHTYAHAGKYSVSLTVTDSAGRSSTAARSLTVAGRITKVGIKSPRRGATVSVTVSSAGTLTVGRRVFHLKRAGTVNVALSLTASQLRTIMAKHQLKVRLPLRFAPVLGPVATTSAVIAFHSVRRGIAASVAR